MPTIEIPPIDLDNWEANKKNDNFEKVVTDTLSEVKELLVVKGKEYRRNDNVYHNFDQGAKIKGITPEKVLDGFLLKHEISIADMTNDLDKGVMPSKEKVEEKFNDNIIYLLIKKAMILNRLK
jgi:predicted patatin/cPLA2 family phospholipase